MPSFSNPTRHDLSDFRFALRQLASTPGFSISAVLILALGIAQNTALFSGANPFLFRPLPVSNPHELVSLDQMYSNAQQSSGVMSVPDFRDWKAQATSFSDMALYEEVSLVLGSSAEPQWVSAARVTPSLINLLGVPPLFGRPFAATEDQRDATPVAVLSNEMWARVFGSDPAILGKTVLLNDTSYTVIGVMPPKFSIPDDADVWIPLVPTDNELNRGNQSFHAIARLKPGVSIDQAETELTTIDNRLASSYPENVGTSARVMPLQAKLVEGVGVMSWITLASGVFVLLIVCANVGNLLLARAVERQREFAIRSALGASRGALFRQLLAEGVVLSSLAGVLGLLSSQALLKMVIAWAPAPPPWVDFSLDGRVLAYTAAAVLGSCLIFSAAPLLEALRVNVQRGLRNSTPGTGTSAERHRLRSFFIVSQIAFALILLYGTGLLLRTVINLQRADLGFDAKNLSTFRIRLPDSRYSTATQRQQFHRTLLDNLREQSGFEAVAAISHLPFQSRSNQSYQVAGRPAQTQPSIARSHYVSPGYFSVMKTRLVAGREFASTDDAQHPPVIIIDQGFAKKEFPGEDPLGKSIIVRGRACEIVGIVAQVRYESIDGKSRYGFFLPYAQGAVSSLNYVVRTASDRVPTNLLQTIEATVKKIDPTLPIYSTTTMADLVARSFWPKRIFGRVLTISAVTSLILAALGLSASVAYRVARQTREIGIRRALGASDKEVLSTLVKQQITLVLIGVGLGSFACLGLGKALSHQLYKVPSFDVVTLLLGIVAFVMISVAACVLPALRATRVDPIIALRSE